MCMLQKILPISLCLLFTLPALGEEEKDPQTPQPMEMASAFEKDILPILKSRCIECHGGATPKASLDLRTVTAILQGGKSGPAIRLDAAETSLLYEFVSSGKMPPQGEPLTSEEQGKIRVWINENARKDLKLAAADSDDGDTTAAEKKSYDEVEYTYWSFTPPRRPPIPDINKSDSENSITNPIDLFLLEQLSAKGLSFSPPAARSTLIRRVYLDMLGILPAPQAIERFTVDDSPIAFQRLLDAVLADPRYGERWGRHWLDVAGYSDSAGVLSADQDRQLIWRFRDYVIRALNRDLPYDQFVREQIAGDEIYNYWDHYENSDALPQNVVEALSATGFLRTAPDASRPDFKTIKNVNGLYYYPTIDNQLQTLTSGLMGITVKCAKCHDHKFDPLTQKNYYQLKAVFMSVYNPDAWIPFRDRKRPVASKRQVDAAALQNKLVDAELAALKKELATLREMKVEELFVKRLGTLPKVLQSDVSAAVKLAADKRSVIQKYLVEKFGKLLRPDAKELEVALLADYPVYKQAVGDHAKKQTAVEQRRKHFDYVYAAYDVPGEPYTPFLRRGDAQTPGGVVRPGVPEMIQADEPFVWEAVEGEASTSLRRTAFANWLTQSRHPLTSRVMANRLWLHHFGEGLVSTVEDFGWAGENPQHQQLLDWLAVELESNQWSLKHLHRLILSSQAYQQSSAVTASHAETAMSVDPNNRLLWRQNLRRMEAEPLRDSILHVAGALRSDMYGAPTAIVRRPDGEVVVNDGKLPQKRSIYLRNKRSAPVSILQLFDQPDIETNCTRRNQSTVPLQALSLLNSDLVVNAAEAFADRVLHESSEDPLGRAFELAYSRPPADAERKTLEAFTQKQQTLHLATSGVKKVWAYGYGTIDSKDPRQVTYTAFPAYEKAKSLYVNGSVQRNVWQWQLGPGYPFKGSFWAGINATSGHPGVGKPVILKWTSPVTGKITINGMVHHPSPAGNGVRTTITSNQQGQAGQWTVAHKRQEINLPAREVQEGEDIFIVLDMNGELTSDNFNWAFTIKEVDSNGQLVQVWDSVSGFHGPLDENGVNQENARKQSIVDLCHVLLSSNEFAYID
jgi:hypothetical protein